MSFFSLPATACADALDNASTLTVIGVHGVCGSLRQHGVLTIPGADTAAYQKEDLAVFDWVRANAVRVAPRNTLLIKIKLHLLHRAPVFLARHHQTRRSHSLFNK